MIHHPRVGFYVITTKDQGSYAYSLETTFIATFIITILFTLYGPVCTRMNLCIFVILQKKVTKLEESSTTKISGQKQILQGSSPPAIGPIYTWDGFVFFAENNLLGADTQYIIAPNIASRSCTQCCR